MFGILKSSIKHYNALLTLKSTTSTGELQKISTKVREESVEAI